MITALPTPNTAVADLTRFKELLLRSCGHTFENEREQALGAAVNRRMEARGITDHDAYSRLLVCESEELLRLTELLTINETYFFREPDHLNLLLDTLLPGLMDVRKLTPVRIVSAGCSTGEEPYSIAIMLRERFGSACERLFTITGVDIDSTAIGVARQGLYGSASFRGTEKNLLDRYFEPRTQGKFQVADSIKKLVAFEVVNLLGPSYPHTMHMPDIILYRNVSIYFPRQVQRDIFGRLAEQLAEGGCLLVGASETIHHDIGILSLIKQDSLFFYRKTSPLVFEERRESNRHAPTAERVWSRAVQSPAIPAARAVARSRQTAEEDSQRPRTPLPPSTRQNVKERFDEAVALAHDMQHAKALAILDDIIEQDHAFEKAYSLKGSLLLGQSHFDEARVVCEGVLERNPLCLEACLMLGMIARQNGDDDAAFKRFREALYLDSSCWLAHFYTAEILFAQQAGKQARSSFETALKILETGELKEHGRAFFPLSFNAEQFIVICRHKLSLLKTTGKPEKSRTRV